MVLLVIFLIITLHPCIATASWTVFMLNKPCVHICLEYWCWYPNTCMPLTLQILDASKVTISGPGWHGDRLCRSTSVSPFPRLPEVGNPATVYLWVVHDRVVVVRFRMLWVYKCPCIAWGLDCVWLLMEQQMHITRHQKDGCRSTGTGVFAIAGNECKQFSCL